MWGFPAMTLRTLLIDNYDSYTYNLFQLLATVNGAEPVVLTNDAPYPTGAGPGRVRQHRHLARVRATRPGRGTSGSRPSWWPGHRCRCWASASGIRASRCGPGCRWARRPSARHGHLTQVTHDGQDLFRGLPQDFTAVRYHSLCAGEPFPAELEATAWAEDGVNMGLRHRDRPLWGVQFHPESVATQFGAGAGRQLPRSDPGAPYVAPWPGGASGGRTARRHHPAGPGEPDGTDQAAGARTTVYRLHTRALPGAVDTEAAFGRLFADQPVAFWLDSARVEAGLSRFSFLGDGSGPLAELVTYQVGSGVVEVRAGTGPVRTRPGTIFDYLEGGVEPACDRGDRSCPSTSPAATSATSATS